MVGWKRFFYNILGWEYPEQADQRQKHLKHLLNQQIKNTDNIKKILKSSRGLKEQNFKKKRPDTPFFDITNPRVLWNINEELKSLNFSSPKGKKKKKKKSKKE